VSVRLLREILSLPATAAGWWWRTTAGSRLEQWFLFVCIPVILSLLWIGGVTSRLEFSLAAESLWSSPTTFLTAFTANYAHIGSRHLIDNLLNFWLTLFAIYPLVAIAGWNRKFRLSMLAYFSLVPFVIAWVTLGALGPLTSQPAAGFSGIVSAFLGFLPVVLFAAAARLTDGQIHPAWASVPFFGSLAVAFGIPTGTYFPANLPVALASGLIAVFLAGVFWQSQSLLSLARTNRQLAPDHRLALLIGSTVFVFGIAGALVFVQPGTNVWGHLAGYIAGFLVPYLAFVVVPLLK